MTKVIVHATARELGEAVAASLLPGFADAARNGKSYLLGCPGGRSPKPVYEALGRRLAARPIDLSRLVIVMMDEYLVERGGKLEACHPGSHFSCRGFAARDIAGELDACLPAAWRIRPENVWLPDPANPAAYDKQIAAAGGIDHFLLASGASDGHVAFNPPGSPRDSRTRVIALAQETRRDNMATFPDFRSIDDVPHHGVSVGIETIAGQSRAATMLLLGESKREAFARVTAAGDYQPDWPATVVAACRNATVVADKAAAGAAP
ncbi:6-phosphogluconolactonase [uncultured Alsobacter sp.]|uniref:6-phosphogluconolactonase n=1 Tax=uncultured Alsobacter sp. TaxID=1748258 RepID=UPI0025D7EBE6|nr:6-phosphogluconolactonase [uncultured Alsobacter sp.]